MRSKIVYAVTSDQHDFYIEQTFLSAYSARLHNLDSFMSIIIDSETIEAHKNNPILTLFLDTFNEVIVVDIDIHNYPKKNHRNRFLKTSLRNHINGDYLYIDGDTIICGELDEVDNISEDFAAVLDFHLPISKRTVPEQNIINSRIGTSIISDLYFNSGVTYCRDNKECRDLFFQWHEDWKEHLASGSYIDQPPLYRALAKSPNLRVRELSGIWNCQIVDNGLKYLADAKIVHIFGSTGTNLHKLFTEETYKEIRKNGGLTDRIKEMIANPKRHFADIIHLCNANATGMIYSDSFTWICDAYYNRPFKYKMFRIMKKVLSVF